ncbi:MAG TPA: hypothetical protein VL866_02025, partial [Pyrinomonadaceae bacterium]|nr:hypothetical protein [Pyrinomonadaceae bacterium]
MKLSLLLTVCTLMITSSVHAQNPISPAELRKLAADYYNWRNENFPVASSDSGLHTWDNRLTDYSLSAILSRRLQARDLLNKVQAMNTTSWTRDDRIDWLLFRAQLEGVVFFNRVINFEESDPQTYVNECSNGIFSLLK